MTRKRTPTVLQTRFAKLTAGGMAFTEAYAEAGYQTDNLTPHAIAVEASRLFASETVSRLVDEEREHLAALDKKAEHRQAIQVLGDSERVLNFLRETLSGSLDATTAQLKSAELLGRAVGLYRDITENLNKTERTSADIAETLEQRLSELLGIPVEQSLEENPVEQSARVIPVEQSAESGSPGKPGSPGKIH